MMLLFFACGLDCSDDPYAPTYENWAEGFFVSKCLPCHGADAQEVFGAPNIDLHNYSAVFHMRETIRRSVLEEQRMPPGGGLLEDERLMLEQWLDCPQK